MFADLNLNERLEKALEQHGYEKPTEIQSAAIPEAIAGKDLLASAETGTGKTAAFLIPIIQKLLESKTPAQGTRALILTPTRELTRQVNKHCKQLMDFTHLKVSAITGGEDYKYQASVLRKDPDVIIATPGRLVEHIERGHCEFKYLEVLVLDEADRMLDMGFAEDLEKIVSQCPDTRQTLCFSATLDTSRIKHATPDILKDPVEISLAGKTQASQQVRHQLLLADDENFKSKAVRRILENGQKRTIVFTNTKAQASRLAGWLKYHDVNAGLLHGDMDQQARNKEMSRLRNDSIKFLIATDVASRGLDVPDIDLVVNFDFPHKVEDFVHRIGRTGRAGKQGLAISLVTARDWDQMVSVERATQIRFEKTAVAGLTAAFKGPQKLKKSGKTAGAKKRNKTVTGEDNKPKAKKRLRDKKNIGKRRKPSENSVGKFGDGFSPLSKK